MSHPRRDVVIGVIAAAASAGSVDKWGHAAVPYLLGLCAVLAIWVTWDVMRPKVRQWRAERRGDTYKKIVGGYRDVNRQLIRFKGGEEEATVMALPATGTGMGHNPVATGTSSSMWKRTRDWWSHRPWADLDEQ